jgi:hypothetical protein
MERYVSLQYSEGRMERTKDTDKNSSTKIDETN